MSFIRARALRSVQSALSRGAPRVSAPRTQLVAKRFASGGHDGHAPPGSDLPWLISALIVTPVSCWYLWPETSHADSHHGHGDHAAHDDADEKHEDKEEDKEEDSQPTEEVAEKEETASEPTEEKSEDKTEDKAEGEAESKSDDEESAESDDNATSGDNNKRGTTGTNKVRSDSEGASVTRKIEAGSKGGNKIRLDSGLGKNLGEGINSDTAYNGSEGSENKSVMADKQKGLSNTDTRHSIQIDAPGSELSTKGHGGPETAKHKGTVDPRAPVK